MLPWFPAGRQRLACLDEKVTSCKHKRFIWKCDFITALQLHLPNEEKDSSGGLRVGSGVGIRSASWTRS